MMESFSKVLLFVNALLLSTLINAQSIELANPSSKALSIKVGEVPKSVVLNYTNTGTTSSSAKTLQVSVPSTQNGIYLYAGKPLLGGLTASESANRSSIDFNIPSLAAGESISLPINIQAGYCYVFQNGISQLTVNNVLLLDGVNSGFTGGNLALTIIKSSSLSQVFSQNKVSINGAAPTVGSLMTVSANVNDVIVREYVYQNPSSTDVYYGYAQLDGPDISSPIQVMNIEAYTSDVNDLNQVYVSGATVDLNTWTFNAPIQVPANGKFTFKETIKVNGCLEGATTPINLSIGVGPWDNCSNTTVTLGPNLNPIKGISFVIDEANSNYRPDLKCISDAINGQQRNIIYTHTGAATALNNTFSLFKYDVESYVIPKSSLRFYIIKNGVKTEYTVDWSANDIFTGLPLSTVLQWSDILAMPTIASDPNLLNFLEQNGLFNPDHSGKPTVYQIKLWLGGRGGYERPVPYNFNPLLYNMFITYGDYTQNGYTSYGGNAPMYYPFLASSLPNGLNTELVFNAQISKYFDNGQSVSITLSPGDQVEIEWEEYAVCLNQYKRLNAMGFWPYTHSEDACGNINYAGYGQNGYFGSSPSYIQDPGNSNIAGEIDRCTLTQDGQVENVGFKFAPNIGLSDAIGGDLNGKLIFKVYLDDGLDLDASFEKPYSNGFTAYKGFNNIGKGNLCTEIDCKDVNNTSQPCNSSDVLPSPTYNVKYTLADGTVIDLNGSVKRIASYGDLGGALDYIKSPGYNAVTSKAYLVYTITMDLSTLGIDKIAAPGTVNFSSAINQFLKDGRLSFDVRCYCPKSSPSGKAGLQVVTLFDKCETPAVPEPCNQAYFTRLWPMGYTQYAYQINCPGCKIPGSNISASTFLRQNTGLLDANQNGFPDDGNLAIPADNIVRRSGTEGDVMKAMFSVDMSDGIAKSSGLGFLEAELEADGVYLDNLIVKVTVNQSTTTYNPGTAKVTYHGTIYNLTDATDYWFSGNTAWFRIPAQLVHSEIPINNGASFVPGFHASDPIVFEADFTLTSLSANNDNIEVLYQAGYTTCETCTSGFYAVSPAFNNTGDYDAVLANKDKLFLMCTDGGTYFKGIMFRSERIVVSYDKLQSNTYHDNESNSQCKKTLMVRNWGEFGYTNNFGQYNMYEQECRYFINENVPVRTEVTLPQGYVIDRIELFNEADQANYSVQESYVIPGSSIASFSNTSENSFWTGTTAGGNVLFGMNLFYKHESESDVSLYQPSGNWKGVRTMTGTLPPHLIVKDEHWYTNVFIILKPATNCTPNSSVVFPENHYLTNIPINPSANPQTITTTSIALDQYYWYNPTYHHQGPTETLNGATVPYFDKVDAQLAILNNTDQSLTVNGNYVELKVKIKELGNLFQADYPFLVLEGPALDPSKGLSFEGLYWSGGKSINYPVYYDSANNRILLGINNDYSPYLDGSLSYSYPAIPKGSSNDYVIRFNYTCSNITDQGCGGNAVIQNGLNHDQITVTPGYGCTYTPTIAQYLNGQYCKIFNPITYDLSSQVYGSGVTPSFTIGGANVSNPSTINLSNCESFNYNIELKSCQEGVIKEFDVLFASLPVGLTITNASILANSDFTVTQDISNPLLYKVSTSDPSKYLSISSTPIIVSFVMKLTCAFVSSTLNVSVNGLASCGGTLSPTPLVHNLTVPSAPFDNLMVDGLQCSVSNILFNYTANATTLNSNTITVTLPAGLQFVSDGSSSTTIVIPSGTTGVTNVSLPIHVVSPGAGKVVVLLNQNATIQCSADDICNRTQQFSIDCDLVYECSASANAGLDQSACYGTSFTLTALNVMSGYTYTWTGGGITYTGTTVTVTPSTSTTYTLTVTSDSDPTCVATDNVLINVNPLPIVTITTADGLGSVLIPTCHEQVILQATSGYAHYQWSYNGVAIDGETNSSHTVNTGYAGAYSVEVTDANGCKNNGNAQVIDGITISGDNQICPSEKASLTININGIIGNYLVQWIKDGGSATTTPQGTSGLYYALVVLPDLNPSCTLRTEGFIVMELPAPSPYKILGGDINFCPGDGAVTLTAVPPINTPTPITSWSWSTGATTNTISVTNSGTYTVSVLGANGCTNSSSTVLVAPSLSISQLCNQDGTTTLTVNANVLGVNTYSWTDDSGTVIGSGPSVTVNQDGVYHVTTSDLRCNASIQTTVCRNSSATSLLVREDFNITGVAEPCSDPPINLSSKTELTCVDQGVALSTGIGPDKWIGKTRITNNAANEVVGSPNLWFGLAYPNSRDVTDQYFLAADGDITTKDDKVWYTTVNVEECATYSFRAMAKNLLRVDNQELPELYLRIGAHEIRQAVLFKNTAWVQLGSTWKSDVTGSVEIAVMLKSGGFVGRDIGVDEIVFTKVDCSDRGGNGTCNAVTQVGEPKYICSGGTIQIGNNTAQSGLTYLWTAPGYSSADINPMVSPTVNTEYTLIVTDEVNQCTATDKVSVTIIQPSVSISLADANACGANFVASLFNGMGSPQYAWFVNGVQVAVNTTGTFAPTDLKNGDKVKCQLLSACDQKPFSNEISVAIATSPKLATPMGVTKLCINANDETYTTTAIVGLTNYVWDIQPQQAGTLTVHENTVSVNWNDTFSGVVTIKVKGVNACGEGEYSDPLTVVIQPSVPVISSIQGPFVLCKNSVNTTYTVSPISFVDTYLWKVVPSRAGVITDHGNGSMTVDWRNSFRGDVRLFVNASNSCGISVTEYAFVKIVDRVQNAPVPNGLTQICKTPSQSITTQYSIPLLNGATIYNWNISPANAATSFISNNNQLQVVWNPSFIGRAYVNVYGSNDCGLRGGQSSLAVTIDNVPGVIASIKGLSDFCLYTTNNTNRIQTYTLSNTINASSYEWSVEPAQAVTRVINRGTSIFVIWNNYFIGSATIKVRGKNACGYGPYTTLNINIKGIGNPLPIIGSDCRSFQTKSSVYTANYVLGAKYQWVAFFGGNAILNNNAIWKETSNQVTIQWNMFNRSEVYLFYRIIGSCGASAWSPIKHITYSNRCGAVKLGENTAPNFRLDNTNNFEVNVFPNPADKEVNVLINGSEEEHVQLKIYSMNGELLYTEEQLTKGEVHHLDLSLSSGIYVVQVVDLSTNELKHLKLVISH